MAKGIRSKIKRQHRSEFRRTIGEDAAAKNREIIQSKLKECKEKGEMNSFERLSNVFQTMQDDTEMANDSPNVLPVDALDTVVIETKGENKVPTAKKSKKRKHSFRAKPDANKNRRERPKPKFFCEF